jgi:2-polyprenyl-3-methyl-5-hydroxy-6-metoxy-1,4-benzoquinol methylase
MNLTAKVPGQTCAQYREFWMRKKVWTRLQKPHHQARLKWCADQCVGEHFIDVGCACGHSTAAMAGFHQGKWYGADFDAKMVEAAREFFPHIKFFAFSDVSQLYTAGVFDSVVCSEVIEHVEDDFAFIKQLWAVTGRKLIVTTPNRFVDDPGHLRVYDQKRLLKLMDSLPDKQSFKIESIGHYWLVTAERRAS